MTSPLFPAPRPAVPRDGGLTCAIAIDAEEDFDWQRPMRGTSYDTLCMRDLGPLHGILSAYGAVPTYLLTYPVLTDDTAVAGLRRALEAGQCGLGVQMHSWVTPPVEGRNDMAASFAANLPPELEARKLASLMRLFTDRFGFAPRIFRAGRYGFGPATAALLEENGFDIDVSLAPRTNAADEGGPDFRNYRYELFRFGTRRRILEAPLCRSTVGWGARAYRSLTLPVPAGAGLESLLARTRCIERVTLSPEGNDLAAMLRLVRSLRSRNHTVLSLSFHSSSLRPGRNPYVRNRSDLTYFYDRLSAFLAWMTDIAGCRFVALQDLPALLVPEPVGAASVPA